MRKYITQMLLLLSTTISIAQEKLTGTIICDTTATALANAQNAFDNNPDTYFQSDNEERAWVGYDLGMPHVINKIKWSPRTGTYQRAITTFTRKNNSYALNKTYRYETTDYGYLAQAAVFQGANKPDFSDAITLHVIQEPGTGGEYDEAEIHVTRGFRYVRFVATAGSMGNMSEIEYYGTPSAGTDRHFYQATNLPLVSINVKDAQEITSQLSKDTLRAYITIVSEDGTSMLEDSCVIRGRGNDSFRYPKKLSHQILSEKTPPQRTSQSQKMDVDQ